MRIFSIHSQAGGFGSQVDTERRKEDYDEATQKKRSIKRKRSMDFYRAAVLEFSVQKLNDEITARCNRKTKRRRKREPYDWHDGSNGVGWNMKNTQKDDDDLLE